MVNEGRVKMRTLINLLIVMFVMMVAGTACAETEEFTILSVQPGQIEVTKDYGTMNAQSGSDYVITVQGTKFTKLRLFAPRGMRGKAKWIDGTLVGGNMVFRVKPTDNLRCWNVATSEGDNAIWGLIIDGDLPANLPSTVGTRYDTGKDRLEGTNDDGGGCYMFLFPGEAPRTGNMGTERKLQ